MDIKKRFVENGVVVTEYFVTPSEAAEVAEKVGLKDDQLEGLESLIKKDSISLLEKNGYSIIDNGKIINPDDISHEPDTAMYEDDGENMQEESSINDIDNN